MASFGTKAMQDGSIDEQLVTALYGTALYGGDWQPALDRFRKLLNSVEAAVSCLRDGLSDAKTWTSGHVLSPDIRQQYFCHYGRIDPKLGLLYRNQANYLFNDARHFDAAFVARDPFYQEFSRSVGTRHTLDMTLDRSDGSERFLAVMRAPSQGPYDRRAERIFRQAADHFLRVLKLKEKIDGAQHGGALVGAALDSLRIAAIVVSAGGRVVLSNRAAEDACGAGEELQLRNGKLTTRSAKFAPRLKAAIHEALQPRGTASVLHLPRAAGGDRIAWIAPLPAERNLADAPGALVLIGELAERGAAGAEGLAALYGLTAAEAALAVAVGNGASLREAAAKRGVKLSTVRSQMLSVLQKTGARRQADLARMLASLPGALLRDN